MSTDKKLSINFITFLTFGVLGIILILNFIFSSVQSVPALPSFKDFTSTLVYSAYFISTLLSGAAMAPNYILTGITITLIFPCLILALIFRRNLLRVIFSVGIYAILLFGLSWLLSLFKVPSPPISDQGILALFTSLINVPFGYFFYLIYLLIGYSIYPLPLVLIGTAIIRYYAEIENSSRWFWGILWGYLEVVLLISFISTFSQKLNGGVLLVKMMMSTSPLVLALITGFLSLLSGFGLVLFIIKKSPKELLGKSKQE